MIGQNSIKDIYQTSDKSRNNVLAFFFFFVKICGETKRPCTFVFKSNVLSTYNFLF